MDDKGLPFRFCCFSVSALNNMGAADTLDGFLWRRFLGLSLGADLLASVSILDYSTTCTALCCYVVCSLCCKL